MTIDSILFTELLPEMFKRVGLDESDINNLTKVPQWFTKKKWTQADEDAFVSWLVPHLCKRLCINKKLASKYARTFVFQYGWSTNEEKQGELF